MAKLKPVYIYVIQYVIAIQNIRFHSCNQFQHNYIILSTISVTNMSFKLKINLFQNFKTIQIKFKIKTA